MTTLDGSSIRAMFPRIKVDTLPRSTGYLNLDGGWANAAQGVQLMTSKVIAMGGKVVPGKSAQRILREDEKTTGVQCTDGTIFDAALVVLAIGAWTASTFRDLDLAETFTATG